ncbi:hypothetical protein L1887_53602 [Cichorium endivia]|nr:hypothetical protein L1887_53602 [Cichorium endivia]
MPHGTGRIRETPALPAYLCSRLLALRACLRQLQVMAAASIEQQHEDRAVSVGSTMKRVSERTCGRQAGVIEASAHEAHSIPACFQTASTRGSGVADANAAVFPAEFVDHGAWTRAAANGIWMERFAGATLRAVPNPNTNWLAAVRRAVTGTAAKTRSHLVARWPYLSRVHDKAVGTRMREGSLSGTGEDGICRYRAIHGSTQVLAEAVLTFPREPELD